MATGSLALQDRPKSPADTVQLLISRLSSTSVDVGAHLQDGKAVAAIEKITISDTDHLSDSWFKTEILGGLNCANVNFINPSANDGAYGIVAVHLATPMGSVVLA